ncbi:sugar-binding transcriptional regulator [Albidovulum sediminicola]|uniref:Sugar-binding transcriptional regulator n=1 Tax=Albidovulum sediminicola TaxID=2984331 RepID=A0ABT2Z6E0_9RHOB|nr:sugar-binding transcriptional regulator [Defluviimonas sp. WL0075]MCV2866714.1 sugar-binding transcriptional regulator [Defluviimonas sp. WL0075]
MSEADLNDDLKTRVAWLYYMEGMTQDEVAQTVGLTRARVLRILASARGDGSVQIRVTTKLSACVELERRLEDLWGLERAIVVPTPEDASKINGIVGAEMARYLNTSLRPDMSIGLGWGSTLTAGVPFIEQKPANGIKVISLLGGLTRVSQVNPSEFAWRVADRLSAECFLMAGPVFAPDAATRDALMAHGGIVELAERAGSLDMAFLSLGDLTPHSIFVKYGLLTPDEIVSLERAGAVGDILCRFVNAQGEIVDHPVNERVFAIPPLDLRRARKLVLASGGWNKVTIIRAAMKMLSPSTLITDADVARRLCEAD